METIYGTMPTNKPQKTNTDIKVIKKALEKPKGTVIYEVKKG